MFNIKVGVLRLCGIACILAVSGCVTKVTDVTANKMGYLNKHFSAQSVNANVAKKISGEIGPAGNFRELKISFSVEIDQGDGKKTLSDCLITYLPAGNGFIQQFSEYSRNNIPNTLMYDIKYGTLPLRWQAVPLQGMSAHPMYETKEISRFEPMPVRAGQKSIEEYTSGTIYDPVTNASRQLTCRATNVGQASAMHQKLKGAAVDIECESRRKGTETVDGRTKWVLLSEYGVPVIVESTTANSKMTYKAIEINIED